jgi:ornithine cyclodeaminase
MSNAALYLTESDVTAALDMRGAILALEAMLTEQGHQRAVNVPKAFNTWGEGCTMHALGSVAPARGYAGFKTWLRTNKGGGSIFSLFDAERGGLLALIEARTLGQLRTGAITGLATQLLAPKSVRHAALIGTGPQAYTQLEAIAAVHTLDVISVFSPTAAKRREFVEQISGRYPFEVIEAETATQALEGAGIVTLITRAQEPFIATADLQAGPSGVQTPKCGRGHRADQGRIFPGHF